MDKIEVCAGRQNSFRYCYMEKKGGGEAICFTETVTVPWDIWYYYNHSGQRDELGPALVPELKKIILRDVKRLLNIKVGNTTPVDVACEPNGEIRLDEPYGKLAVNTILYGKSRKIRNWSKNSEMTFSRYRESALPERYSWTVVTDDDGRASIGDIVCEAKISAGRWVSVIPDYGFILAEMTTEIDRQFRPEWDTAIPPRDAENNTVLSEIDIPEGITRVGEEAFKGCKKLKRVSIPDSVTEIEDGAFADSGLIRCKWPIGATVINSRVFEGCKSLEAVMIPDTVTEIGFGAFSDCPLLEEIALPQRLDRIGFCSFSNSGLY